MTVTKESIREALDRAEKLQLLGLGPFKDAARFVERLLPATCDACNLDQCEDCHGTGQLWDEGLVEALTFVLDTGAWDDKKNYARAVLAALTAEVGK